MTFGEGFVIVWVSLLILIALVGTVTTIYDTKKLEEENKKLKEDLQKLRERKIKREYKKVKKVEEK